VRVARALEHARARACVRRAAVSAARRSSRAALPRRASALRVRAALPRRTSALLLLRRLLIAALPHRATPARPRPHHPPLRPPSVPARAVYNYLTTAVVTIAALAYLTMALGGTQVSVAGGRPFLWIRYADWVLTTPLLLLDLGLLAGAPLVDIGWVVFMDVIMVVAGVAGVLSTGTGAAWPLFTFGCFAFFPVLYALVVTFSAAAKARGPKTASLYSKLAVLMAVTWTAYPVIWVVAEGAQLATPDAETVAYAIFDVIAKCVFGIILVLGHGAIEDEEPTESAPLLRA